MSPGAVFQVHDAMVTFVEPAEVNGSKVDGPDGVTDLFEADEVTFEKAAHEDLPVVPA
jgi:hypothetical protein